MTRTEWHIIGRGWYGWHADGIGQYGEVRGSGGDLAKYVSEATEGAYVYDAYDADSDQFQAFVIRGPMIGINRIDPDDAPIGMLSLVSPERYIGLLRDNVNGVLLGRVHNGAIEWEE